MADRETGSKDEPQSETAVTHDSKAVPTDETRTETIITYDDKPASKNNLHTQTAETNDNKSASNGGSETETNYTKVKSLPVCYHICQLKSVNNCLYGHKSV